MNQSKHDLIVETGRRILKALDQQGHIHTQKGDGLQATVGFSRIAAAEMWAAYVVDTDPGHLPYGVSVPDLSSPRLLEHLGAVIGYPVRVLNHTGLTYVVQFERRQRVRLPRSVRLNMDDRPAVDGLMVPYGIGPNGPVWHPLTGGHVLVAGATGSGKSTFVQVAMTALLSRHTPDELLLAIVDAKRGAEFAMWAGAPHLTGRPIATNADEALDLIGWVRGELDRRAALFRDVLARDLAGYNAQAERPLPIVWLIVDEALTLAEAAGGDKSELMKGLTDITVQGRAFGVVPWLCSQSPRFDTLPASVKGSLARRVVFRMSTASGARMAGLPGAHELPEGIPGRLLTDADGQPETLQGYFLSDDALLSIARRISGLTGPALTPDELRLARLAIDELSGRYHVAELYALTGPVSEGGISKDKITAIGQRWERRRWIERRDATKARYITAELVHLVR